MERPSIKSKTTRKVVIKRKPAKSKQKEVEGAANQLSTDASAKESTPEGFLEYCTDIGVPAETAESLVARWKAAVKLTIRDPVQGQEAKSRCFRDAEAALKTSDTEKVAEDNREEQLRARDSTVDGILKAMEFGKDLLARTSDELKEDLKNKIEDHALTPEEVYFFDLIYAPEKRKAMVKALQLSGYTSHERLIIRNVQLLMDRYPDDPKQGRKYVKQNARALLALTYPLFCWTMKNAVMNNQKLLDEAVAAATQVAGGEPAMPGPKSIHFSASVRPRFIPQAYKNSFKSRANIPVGGEVAMYVKFDANNNPYLDAEPIQDAVNNVDGRVSHLETTAPSAEERKKEQKTVKGLRKNENGGTVFRSRK